jgi:hypothetical protein
LIVGKARGLEQGLVVCWLLNGNNGARAWRRNGTNYSIAAGRRWLVCEWVVGENGWMDEYGGADLRKKGGKSSGLEGWDAKTAQGVGEKHCDVGGRTRNSRGWTALESRRV